MTQQQSNKPYQVFARKYRPQSFVDLIGQEAMVQTLTNAIEQDRIAQAFMLTGIRGIGKTTTARIIARTLNCEGADGKGVPTPTPCGVCSHCVSIAEDRHPDVIEMDAASRTGVDDVREIIENVKYKPASARYKVYIIDEVHMLSKNAFNALLKTLEEPPKHVKFIFATTEIRKVPVTILSRCQRFDLRRISLEQLSKHLQNIAEKESVTLDNECSRLIANAAEGSVRDALSLLDQSIAFNKDSLTAANISDMLGLSDKTKIIELFSAISKGNIADSFSKLQALYNDSAQPVTVFHDLLEIAHLVIRYKIVPDATSDDIPESIVTQTKTLSEQLDHGYLSRCWQMLLKGIQEIKIAPNPLAAAEMVIIRIAYMADLPSPASIVRKLQDDPASAYAPATGSAAVIERTAPASASAGSTTATTAAPQTQTAPVSNDAPVAQLVSNSNGNPATAMALAPSTEIVEDTHAKNKTVALPQNFEDATALFDQNNEPLLYNFLRSEARLVAFEIGKIELAPSPLLPKDFAGRVSEALTKWTDTRWVVAFSNQQGAATIAEQDAEKLQAHIAKLEQHPHIQKVKDAFPGAKIIHIDKGDRT